MHLGVITISLSIIQYFHSFLSIAIYAMNNTDACFPVTQDEQDPSNLTQVTTATADPNLNQATSPTVDPNGR